MAQNAQATQTEGIPQLGTLYQAMVASRPSQAGPLVLTGRAMQAQSDGLEISDRSIAGHGDTPRHLDIIQAGISARIASIAFAPIPGKALRSSSESLRT